MPNMGYLEELRAVVGSRQLVTIGVGVIVLRGEAVLLELRRDSQDWAFSDNEIRAAAASLASTARTY